MPHDQCGLCSQCNTLNPYSVFDCRECGARLPWADALTQKLFEGQQVATGLAQQGPGTAIPVGMAARNAAFLPNQNQCMGCGAPLPPGSQYCPSCGKRFTGGVMTNAAPPPLAQQWPLGSHQLATLQNDNVMRVVGVALALMFFGWVLISGAFGHVSVLAIIFAFILIRRLLR